MKRDDVRQHPVRAVLRRVIWRVRWLLLPRRLWLIHARGFRLFTMRSGAGALIYYQGVSEPETATLIRRLLKRGMVFADVGAHIGEYSVLAARVLESTGHVHAFEPRPDVFDILKRNIRLNNCWNVTARSEAAWDVETQLELALTSEPSLSAVQLEGEGLIRTATVRVRAITLDRYFARRRRVRPNLMKVDVEGAELRVLKGAASMLTLPPVLAPVVIFEYGPAYSRRFGCAPDGAFSLLREYGYLVYGFLGSALVGIDQPPVLQEADSTCNLVAAKHSLTL